MNHRKINFSRLKYDFEILVEDLFNITDLKQIHHLLDKEYSDTFKVGADSITNVHKKFYDKYRGGWDEMEVTYNEFIKWVIAPIHRNNPMAERGFLYQKFPTFRIHIPGNLAVGDFHTDAEFNHPDGEINYIIPLTTSHTATIWVESYPGSKDFSPIPMQIGELIEFNGNKLRHGNKVNETEATRVSMDFRILPLGYYRPNEQKGSMTLGTKFVEGQYYKRFEYGKD